MKPYSKRNLIGVAVLSYDEQGKPITGRFKPVDFKLNPAEVEKLLTVPVRTVEEVLTNAQTILSSWMLKNEELETADRERSRIETNVITCEKWPGGEIPKLCEVAFYFATSEPGPRQFTGVR